MKETLFSPLLNENFSRKDFLSIYTEIYLIFNPTRVPGQLIDLAKVGKSLHSDLNRTINRFFDTIGVLSFNNEEDGSIALDLSEIRNKKRMKTRSTSQDVKKFVESKPLQLKVSHFLYQLENAMIFLTRMLHSCLPVLIKIRITEKSAQSLFYFACWDKWLRHIDYRILWRVFQLENELFNNKIQIFWEYVSQQGTESSKIRNFKNKSADHHEKFHMTNFYTKVSPIKFYYIVAKETENVEKYTAMIYFCLGEECQLDKFENLLKLNDCYNFFEDKGKAEYIQTLKKFMEDIFPGKCEKEITKYLMKYRNKTEFILVSLIIALDLQNLFFQELLNDSSFLEAKKPSNIYNYIFDGMQSSMTYFEDDLYWTGEEKDELTPERKILNSLEEMFKVFKSYFGF